MSVHDEKIWKKDKGPGPSSNPINCTNGFITPMGWVASLEKPLKNLGMQVCSDVFVKDATESLQTLQGLDLRHICECPDCKAILQVITDVNSTSSKYKLRHIQH